MSKISIDNIVKSMDKAKETTGVLKFRPHEEILSLSILETNPYNDFAENDTPADIQELADDIKLNGLMHPLVINKIDGHFRLISGECRFRALQKLRYDNVRCTVYNDLPLACELRMLYAANLKVRTYTPAERIKYYEKLKELLTAQKAVGEYDGPIQSSIAGMMGVSDRQVRKYERISENLGEDDKEKLAQGEISVEQAYRIAQGKPKKTEKSVAISATTGSEVEQTSIPKPAKTGSTSGFTKNPKESAPPEKEKKIVQSAVSQDHKADVTNVYTDAWTQLRKLYRLFHYSENAEVANKLHGIILKLNDVMESEGFRLGGSESADE